MDEKIKDYDVLLVKKNSDKKVKAVARIDKSKDGRQNRCVGFLLKVYIYSRNKAP